MYKIFILFLMCMLSAVAADYNVYNSKDYSKLDVNNTERVIFILDFSNSMNEFLEGQRKVDLMVNTMKKLLPNIGQNISVGLRVYGHKSGFTPIDACRASGFISSDKKEIYSALSAIQPVGMTPITYSLKQSLKNDFIGFRGKKHIILLTDGGENCDESPCKYVMELVKIRKDVQIDVIAFNVNNEDDLSQLECTSLVTSGKFYNAQTAAELVNSMNRSIDSIKQVEAKIILH